MQEVVIDKNTFWFHWKRLIEVYPNKFLHTDTETMRKVFNEVEPLEEAWIKSFVDRVIRTNNLELDVIKAAKGEKMARKRALETEAMLGQESSEISSDGLLRALNDIGADSLLDAVLKSSTHKD